MTKSTVGNVIIKRYKKSTISAGNVYSRKQRQTIVRTTRAIQPVDWVTDRENPQTL